MTDPAAGRPFSRFLVPAVGVGAVGLFGVLFVVDDHHYRVLLTAWMLNPFPHPFIDWEYIPAAAECWSRGIDVYVATPCYGVGPTLKNSYSPLWLRLGFLPTGPASVAAFGIGWAVAFWAAQAYLPPPRSRRELEVTLLVALSSLTAFAVERGNADLIVFVLVVIGTALWLGALPSRLLAYAVFLLAGLLKYYPLILLLLAVRERPRVFVPLTVVTTAALLAVAIPFRGELRAALRNVPTGSYFTDLFGSVNLPFGLPVLTAHLASSFGAHPSDPAAFSWLSAPAYAALVLGCALGAAGLAFRAGLREGLASLPRRRHALLVAGSLLLCGCYFAGQSVGYRGIFLILLLPGLFELRRALPAGAARCMRGTIYAIVFVAWVLTLEWLFRGYGLTRGYALDEDGWGLLHWTLHELAWWWIVTVLLATVMSFVANSIGSVSPPRPAPRARAGGLPPRLPSR